MDMAALEVLHSAWKCQWTSLGVSRSHTRHRIGFRVSKSRVSHERFNRCLIVTKASAVEEQATPSSTLFDWNREWYPVAIEKELDKRVPHAVTVLGTDLVLWWDANARQWQVFSDKCPHRLAPLSEGRINENGHIQCSYHGWTFAPQTGSCSRIPQAQPGNSKLVASSPLACAKVYPSVEQQGILWMCLSKPSQLSPPFFPVLEDSSFVRYWATSEVPYGYEALIENLMDPTHVPFAHHRLQGNRDRAGPVDFTVNKFDRNGFKGTTGRGNVVFMPPCSFMMEIQMPPKQRTTYTIFICVPVLPGRSRVYWSFPRNFAKSLNLLTPMWLAHLRHMLVLDSDLYLLHLMEHKQRQNEKEYCPTSADAFVLGFRRWLSVYGGGTPGYPPHIDRKLSPSPSKKQLMDRYENHVKRCPTCRAALSVFERVEVGLQIVAIAALAVALIRRSWWGVSAVLLWAASRFTSHFISKNYHFHDYNHAMVK